MAREPTAEEEHRAALARQAEVRATSAEAARALDAIRARAPRRAPPKGIRRGMSRKERDARVELLRRQARSLLEGED
jgi:hypothetical protein